MDPLARALLVNIPGFTLPLLAFLTLRYARPNRPYGRILLSQAIGFAIWAVSSTLWTFAGTKGHGEWPSPIDAVTLLGYVAFVMSNVLFLKLLHESGLVQGLANSVLGALMVIAVYAFLMISIGQPHQSRDFSFLVSLLYRFLDVFVLSLTTVNAVFLLRIRESLIGQLQLTIAVGFVLLALGNAFSVAILLRTGQIEGYTTTQALMITAFYVSSLIILIGGYVHHLVGIRRRFGSLEADDSLILRESLLGAYENALADLVEYVREKLGTNAAATIRRAAHKLGAGPSSEIDIAASGLPTRVLTEPEWKALLVAVRDEFVAEGGALMNPAFEKIRARYGEKLRFLEPVAPRSV